MKHRRSLAALAVTALAGAGLLTSASTSSAASDPSAPVLTALSRAAQVRAYWTRDRMLDATPMGAEASGGSTSTRLAPRTTTGQAIESGSSAYVPKTVGKLFFTDGSVDYVCSASTIATRSRNQIVTAGHCVHTGPHPDDGLLGGLLGGTPHYFANWMYAPRYLDGRTPLGKWVATNRFVASGWINSENFDQDQAILALGAHNGKRIVDVTGGNRVAYGASANQGHVRIWGWPAASPYDGESAWRCDGTTVRDDSDNVGDARIACSMTQGSSGGPWILAKNRTANIGTIFAVTSRGTVSGPSELLAHPFTWSLRTLIQRANG
ncbi:trypsin-like serine peptidase [Nocardioides montaniterrae]